ncbi:FG-GAP-like repeat-containing protein [Rugosimonospora africana]|uniref:Peptidase C51 domain-containing protein n=1 Tax=Rugosimonospora africana TaxID=556532 RepID=A0A8J3VV11_9ACTN|nr:FG-GAP-like repeat-containing protein [Rugosimonospora africana]GIH19316.1 hypothetical protein Raf01_74880 [Rugosimonospora africana]
MVGVLAGFVGAGALVAPQAAQAAGVRDQIASVALSQVGKSNCPGLPYGLSCGIDWCSAFAKWVWGQAGVSDLAGLTAESGSFYTYGQNRGTLHSTPQVGDAVVFNYHGGGNADHVGLVVAVGTGTFTMVAGNEGNLPANQSHVQKDNNVPAHLGGVYGGQTIDAFVSPAGAGGGTPIQPDLNVDGISDLVSLTSSGDLHAYPGTGQIVDASAGSTFWAPRSIGHYGSLANLALGDLNHDGIADLITQHTDGNLYAYPGTGQLVDSTAGLTFWAPRSLGNYGSLANLAADDITQDGIADLVTQHTDGNLYAYPGTGQLVDGTAGLTFWAPRSLGNYGQLTDLGLGDLDHDGIADLVTQHADGNRYAYPGSGDLDSTTRPAFWAPRALGVWGGHVRLAL